MKKEINSKSKRKWIMGGLAAFASVALLTTGFAVWVVGTSKTDASNNVTVSVDTANNKSIVFTWNAGDDSTIDLKESNATSGKIVNVEGNDTVNQPLEISYAQSYIKYGSSYDFNFKSIQFSIAEPSETEEDIASVKVNGSGSLTGDGYARTGSEYTYIKAPKAINIASLTPVESGNTKTITISNGFLEFGWGDFFDGKSPAEYYNNLYQNETDQEKLTTAADEITSELTAMNTQLNGKKIKLVATLSTTEVKV